MGPMVGPGHGFNVRPVGVLLVWISVISLIDYHPTLRCSTFNQRVLAGYRYLSNTYEPGDKIFIYGEPRHEVGSMPRCQPDGVIRIFSWCIPSDGISSHDQHSTRQTSPLVSAARLTKNPLSGRSLAERQRATTAIVSQLSPMRIPLSA